MTELSSSLILPRTLINTILTHAQKHPNYEVCGLIGEDSNHHKFYYPIRNVDPSPQRHFLMDGAEQIAAMKSMRENEQTLFAIVHSHPTAAALPSRQDIDESSYPDAYYLITSLNTKGVLELRAYRRVADSMQDKKMQEVELVLE